MGSLLKEISSTEINSRTKNGGASKQCALWAAQYAASAYLCGRGAPSSCEDMKTMQKLMGMYCSPR